MGGPFFPFFFVPGAPFFLILLVYSTGIFTLFSCPLCGRGSAWFFAVPTTDLGIDLSVPGFHGTSKGDGRTGASLPPLLLPGIRACRSTTFCNVLLIFFPSQTRPPPCLLFNRSPGFRWRPLPNTVDPSQSVCKFLRFFLTADNGQAECFPFLEVDPSFFLLLFVFCGPPFFWVPYWGFIGLC